MMNFWRSRRRGSGGPALAALFSLCLSACQQGGEPARGQALSEWRVIESLGETRIEHGGSHVASAIRPGDRVAGNSRIVTGRGAHLIMAQPDFQFTAAGNTAVVLPASGQPGNLAHHRGVVRFRLAAAADAVRRITTPHLVANGTNAVFDVLVDDRETLITVTTGSVVLSTSTGLNYASLTAGAAARVGDQTLGRLEIQPAAGMPFRASAELGTATIAVDAAAPKGAAKARHATPPMTATRPMTVAENAARDVEPTGASASKLAAILPAGRPRNPPREPRLERGSTEDPFAVVPERPDQPSFIPAASRSHVKPEVDGSARSSPPGNAFDRLTDGLLDDLPTASTSPKRGS